jgi:hypothetical protein
MGVTLFLYHILEALQNRQERREVTSEKEFDVFVQSCLSSSWTHRAAAVWSTDSHWAIVMNRLFSPSFTMDFVVAMEVPLPLPLPLSLSLSLPLSF